jgi:CBS domain-containing protein
MNSYTINKDLTLLDGLVQIEKNHHRSLIVLNDNNKVVGSLSDGDIRRALINGILLSSKIYKTMNLDYIFVEENATESEVNDIFTNSDVFLLPRINKNRILIELHIHRQ